MGRERAVFAFGVWAFLLLVAVFGVTLNVPVVKGNGTPRNWTVDDDGQADFHTIQEAINAANPGDTIYVYNGTYYEIVVVNKNNLTLVGENPSITVIDGGSPIEDVNVVTVTASNVNIKGFTVQNCGQSMHAWMAGIHLDSATECNITGNNITNNIEFGITLKHSSYNNISGNNITDNNLIGIGFEDSSNNNNISDNNITNNGNGIYLLQSCKNNMISENTITNNTWGIVIRAYSSHNIISGNTIANNSRGVELSAYSPYNTLSGNNIADNTLDGVIILMSSYHTIRENNITNSNRWGVWLAGYGGILVLQQLLS
ncbi:MAG: pectinesterase family protein [Candidatus Bathyarchaeota archaeon]